MDIFEQNTILDISLSCFFFCSERYANETEILLVLRYAYLSTIFYLKYSETSICVNFLVILDTYIQYFGDICIGGFNIWPG